MMFLCSFFFKKLVREQLKVSVFILLKFTFIDPSSKWFKLSAVNDDEIEFEILFKNANTRGFNLRHIYQK